MKRRQSNSSNTRRKQQLSLYSQNSSSKKQHQRQQSYNEPAIQQTSQVTPGSNFGEEIEDQYYKTSMPGGLLMSPKHNSDAPKLLFNSGHNRKGSGGNNAEERLNIRQQYNGLDGDLVDMDAEEGQFAHLSVEDDDSNQDEDLMANFGIEVESEGQHEDGDIGGFNEADFKLFQRQRLEGGLGSGRDDDADDMLGLLEADQPQFQLDDDGETDDYGIKVGSPLKLKQHEFLHPATTSPLEMLEQHENSETLMRTDHYPEHDSSEVHMIRDNYAGSDENLLQPMEILETDNTDKPGRETNEETKMSPFGQLLVLNQSEAPIRSRGGQITNSFQPPIQIKSFVKMEGKLPSSLSHKNDNVLVSAAIDGAERKVGDNQSTSMLQQTPLEGHDDLQAVMVSSGGNAARLLLQASFDRNAAAAVKVSQFTDQSKSSRSSQQQNKFEFDREVMKQSQAGSSKSKLSLTLGSAAPELNKMQKLGSQTLTGQLGATQSDLNMTKGAELALKDLLNSSPCNDSQTLNNRQNLAPYRPSQQQPNAINSMQEQQLIKCERQDFGPEGHETPDSMNHYSKDEDSNFLRVQDASDSRILEHKLPATFQHTINSARSSIKPDDVAMRSSRSKALGACDSKAYLEDKDLAEPSQRESHQSPVDTQGAFEFKTSINFEFKGVGAAESDDEGRPLSPSSDQGSQEGEREVHTTQNVHSLGPQLNAHEYEAVAIENALGQPSLKLKSKTSMGFASKTGAKMRGLEQAPCEDENPRNLSHVDKKRKLDTKLSIVRRNAEKLKQKRKDEVYQQSSSTQARAKSVYSSSKGATALNYSTASTVPRPLNLTRLQISQKVLSKELEKPNLPLSATKGRSYKTVKQCQVSAGLPKKPKLQQPPMPNRFDSDTKKVFHVSRPSIPKQAISNAAKNPKQPKTTSSSVKKQSKQKLPTAMQKMSKPHQQLDTNSLSQGTFNYRDYRQDRPSDLTSVRSHQATNMTKVESPSDAKNHQRLQTSVKQRVLEYHNEEEEEQSGKPPHISSQTSLRNQTDSKSLKRLQEKYGRGSPRIQNNDQNSSLLGMHAQPNNGRSPKASWKPSMASVFDRNNKKIANMGNAAQKPPLSVKMTVAEVRAKEQMERQENVLRMQLEKIDSKLNRKREQISKKREEISQNSRKTVKQNSASASLYGSIVTATQAVQPVNKEAASFARHPSRSSHISIKGVRKPSHSEVQRYPDSVAQSISKYKKKRMESLAALQKNAAARSASKGPLDGYIEEEQKSSRQYQIPKVHHVLRVADQSTKPVFESPRASTAVVQSPTQNKQNETNSVATVEVVGISHRAVNDGSLEKPENVHVVEHQTNSIDSSQEILEIDQVQDAMGTDHADQKMGFESIHEAMAAVQPSCSATRQQQVQSPKSNGSTNGYHALRTKNGSLNGSATRVLKTGNKFESLRNYMKKTEKYRDMVEPHMISYPRPNSLLFNDKDICSPKDLASSSMQQPKLSPEFSTKPQMEATFNKPTKHDESLKSSTSKKDQKSSEIVANGMSPSRMSFAYQRDSLMQQVTSPRVSLTPVLKDSSQAKRIRRESIQQDSRTGGLQGAINRSCLSQEKQCPTETTMFKAPGSATNTKDDSIIVQQQQKPANFFMSNLFKKLSKDVSQRRPSDQISDIRSQISRPDQSQSQNMIHAGGRITTMAYQTEPSIMDMSGTLSHTPINQLPQQQLPHREYARVNQQQKFQQVVAPRIQDDHDQKHNKAVDYIEEAKDYQRVIHDLKSLLHNPRQHKPLKASSTSDISYLSQQPQVLASRAQNSSSYRKSTSPLRKTSPRLMKKVQCQLGVNQKRKFNPNAFITIGPKAPQRTNQTIVHDRAVATIEPALDSINYSLMRKSPSIAANLSTQGQIKRASKLTKTKLATTTHLNPHHYPSQTSLSVRSGNTGSITRITAGKIFNNSRRSQVTLQSHQANALSMAEQRRKETFDRSLQREVNAIEKVISHRQEQPKQPGHLKTQAQINNYVDSLKQQPQIMTSYANTIEEGMSNSEQQYGSAEERSYLSTSPQVTQTATLTRIDQLPDQQQHTARGSISTARQHIMTTTSPYSARGVDHGNSLATAPASTTETERKTQDLMRQIQQLQPMVLQAHQRNTDAARQIQDLMELHQDIQTLQESQSQSQSQTQSNLRPIDRMSLHEMLPSQHIRMISGQSVKNVEPKSSVFYNGSLQKYLP